MFEYYLIKRQETNFPSDWSILKRIFNSFHSCKPDENGTFSNALIYYLS